MLQQRGIEPKRSKYRLLGLIGQGQFGQVFCAVHRQTGRLVALKNLEHDRFPTHKFLRELRFLLSLQHPNIVTCQALEHTATGRYLVMDYCEGGTLRNLITEESRPNLPYSLKIVADVLAGLDHAHSRGIVHCDIKPENILMHVQSDGWTARISDFGIARLTQEIPTQEGDTGSPAYMAPERFHGQFSVASDLYSVGILLFELLTGHRPFSGTPAELMAAHLNRPLKLPDTIPSAWRLFITQALQKLPAQRFRSATEMLAAMKAIAATEKVNWNDLSTQNPLFYTVTSSFECSFQPFHQEPLSEQITTIAPSIPAAVNDPAVEAATIVVYRAAADQLSQQIYQIGALFSENQGAEKLMHQGWTTTEPIEQLLVRPQGCFVVMRRSIALLPFNSSNGFNLQPIERWEQDSAVTIDPGGHWFASLSTSPEGRQLDFWQLPGQHYFVASRSIAVMSSSLAEAWSLLALDSRHLAIFITQPALIAETTLQVLTRRGTWLGSLNFSLRLQQIILTPTPHRLLAIDDQPGTVLLIDLKPYRVRRFWVEISPTFLVATEWGYILAEAKGRIVFIDQEGRQLGKTISPFAITAVTFVQPHGLLLATWNGSNGYLYFLDLQTLGLDLIF